ncbi:peptidase M23 [Microbacterium sp. ZW T5_56]|uniref:peptidase M23 n=1 Tax=Microbacterium sp. ZW T5_56 TaxID=3378081 RepID=UPI0038518795
MTSPARRSPQRRKRRLTKKQRAARREWRLRGIILAAIVGVVGITVAIIAATPPAPVLPDVASVRVDPSSVPAMTVDGYDQEQLVNAAVIIDVGNQLGLGPRDQAIAVMTAMGESSLRNIDYGDWETAQRTNPDGSPTSSVGLFQQQDWWGTRDERLDPSTSAHLFYAAMLRKVPDRDGLEPTVVAHLVQVNSDEQHYAKYWDSAVAVIAALAQS